MCHQHYPCVVEVSVQEAAAQRGDPGEHRPPLDVVCYGPEEEGRLHDVIKDHNLRLKRELRPVGVTDHCVCVCVYLGSVVFRSFISSLKYCGALTMTGSDEDRSRSGSSLDSTTAFTNPIQSN